jgi:drug/metabolite transporter (DMT)-like permease
VRSSPSLRAILQALLVTFLWSTSWVLIRFGLADIPPILFAGLRYGLAFLVLLAVWLRRRGRTRLAELTRGDWAWLLAYGVVFYALTQGAQFVGLGLLPAITLSLLLNFSAVFVPLLGIPFLKEIPTRLQWLGIGVFLVGVALYFWPDLIPAGLALGLAVGMFGTLSTSVAGVMGRFINRAERLDALTVTVVSMGIGALALLAAGVAFEPIPRLTLGNWVNLVWLAVVNTAFTFWLWNHTQRTLTATQSNMINNTMLVQIAVLAWLFLGETPSGLQILGMAVVMLGVVMVNLNK